MSAVLLPPSPRVFPSRAEAHVVAPPEIDAHNAGDLRSLLAGCDPRRATVVDFSAVTYCGAAGIHALLAAQARHERNGGTVVVRGANPRVTRIFTLTQTTGLLYDET